MALYIAPHLIEEKKDLKSPTEVKKETIDNTKVITNSPYGTIDTFESLKAARNLSFKTPTIIQRHAIPVILNNHPLICRAPTGMGKTICFLLPLIENLKYAQGIMICVMAPTRELCDQIKEEAMKIKPVLRVEAVYGGSKYLSTYKNVNIVIGAPGRLLELLNNKLIDFSRLVGFVLDEADRLLDMGFEKDIRAIKEFVPSTAKCYLFSATYHNNLNSIINHFLPKDRISIEIENETLECINQEFIKVKDKDAKLRDILEGLNLKPVWNESVEVDRVLIFVGKRVTADAVSEKINSWKIKASSIHGEKDQVDRTSILNRFKKRIMNVLVATSVAARGIDIKGINYVINYDFPRDIKDYIHRIGRTGRQGKAGKAISFISSGDLTGDLRSSLIKVLEESKNKVPSFIKDSSGGNEREERRSGRSRDGHSSVKEINKELKKMSISDDPSNFTQEKEDSDEDMPGVW